MRYKPTEVVSADELESIHDASLQVLEEIGMDFLDEEARDLLAAAGARVEPGTERVRFDRAMVEERIKTAPSSFTLHARNPEHDLEIGGDWMAFGSVASAPNVSDLERGRRVGNRTDYQDLLRLAQMLNTVHFLAGYPDMRHTTQNVAVAEAAGYDVLDTYTLPGEAWVDGYYEILEPRAKALLDHPDRDVRDFARETVREIDIFRASEDSYGYVFYVLQRS